MRDKMPFEDDVVLVTHLFGHEYALSRYANANRLDKIVGRPVERRIKEFLLGYPQAASWAEKEWPGIQVEKVKG